MDENLGQKVPFRAGEKQSAFTRLLKLYMGRLLSLPISWIKFAFIYLVIFTTILVIHGRKEAFYFSRRVLSAIQNAFSVHCTKFLPQLFMHTKMHKNRLPNDVDL